MGQNGAGNAIADLSALGGLAGSAANALGFQGSGPGNLNALQRMAMSPEQQTAYAKASALADASQDPNVQQMQPADQMDHAIKLTGDPTMAGNFVAAMNRGKLQPGNNFLTQGVQSGNIEPKDALTYLANPNVNTQAGFALLNNGQANKQTPSSQSENQSPSSQNGPPQSALASSQSSPSGINWNIIKNLKVTDPIAGSIAESMVLGTENPETGRGENDPKYVLGLQAANQADPSLKGNFLNRAAMRKNITSGPLYQTAVNLNTVGGHLYDLNDAADRLPATNTGGTFTNGVKNDLNTWFSSGPAAQGIANYNQIAGRSSEEIAKLYGGGTSTDTSRASAADAFSANKAPKIIKSNAQDAVGMAMSKADATQHEYDQGMGNAATAKILSPQTEALFKDIQGKPLTLTEQQWVNQHRAESKLPLKSWGKAQTANQPVPLNASPQQTKAATQPSSASTSKYQEGQIVRSKSDPTKFAKIVNGIPTPLTGAQ
jgi:hypothetical protein